MITLLGDYDNDTSLEVIVIERRRREQLGRVNFFNLIFPRFF